MNTELVIVWNGAHHGADADLLCCAPLGERRVVVMEGTDLRPRLTSQDEHDALHQRVKAVLADGQWHSIGDLARRTDGTARAMHVVVQRLRRANHLQRGTIPKTMRLPKDGRVAYRLRAGQGPVGRT